jgi:hypothetical protein
MAGIIGIPGRHQSESMAAFVRNRWPASSESAADARQACLSYDIDPMTLGYHQCIASETRTHVAAAPSLPGSAQQ